jgi:hypothetical protein
MEKLKKFINVVGKIYHSLENSVANLENPNEKGFLEALKEAEEHFQVEISKKSLKVNTPYSLKMEYFVIEILYDTHFSRLLISPFEISMSLWLFNSSFFWQFPQVFSERVFKKLWEKCQKEEQYEKSFKTKEEQ